MSTRTLSRTGSRQRRHQRAFSLVELLISVSVIAMLLAILLPSLAGARDQAKSAVCASNIRQIALANLMYAQDDNDRLCPGAADFLHNLHRWHGARDRVNQPFDSARGPITPYLGPDGRIRRCPSFRGFDDGTAAFEAGSGAYGYNNAFLGVELQPFSGDLYTLRTDRGGAALDRVGHPSETLMFADAAFAADRLIEYSFAEPRFFPTSGWRADPSVHFRHSSAANIAWTDGHVDRRLRTDSYTSGLYTADPARLGIGWFGRSDTNRYFDLR